MRIPLVGPTYRARAAEQVGFYWVKVQSRSWALLSVVEFAYNSRRFAAALGKPRNVRVQQGAYAPLHPSYKQNKFTHQYFKNEHQILALQAVPVSTAEALRA